MKKIILKSCDVKEFSSLIKRSSVQDNLIFINLRGSDFESTAYNKTKSALKSITANLEEYCDQFINERGDELTKIQFSNTNKLIAVLGLVGADSVDITFYIEENGYAKKVIVENTEINLTIPTADKEALNFLEIPETARNTIFVDTTQLQYKVGITDSEFKYLKSLFDLNSEICRVCFSIKDDVVTVSEIEGTDENVREQINGYINDANIDEFNAFSKIYSKKLTCDSFENSTEDGYLKCFRKEYFKWIDVESHYDIEFHTNKIKFVSVDGKGAKTYVVLTPVTFA